MMSYHRLRIQYKHELFPVDLRYPEVLDTLDNSSFKMADLGKIGRELDQSCKFVELSELSLPSELSSRSAQLCDF